MTKYSRHKNIHNTLYNSISVTEAKNERQEGWRNEREMGRKGRKEREEGSAATRLEQSLEGTCNVVKYGFGMHIQRSTRREAKTHF